FVGETNPLLVEGSRAVSVPYRWVQSVGDIVVLRYFPKRVSLRKGSAAPPVAAAAKWAREGLAPKPLFPPAPIAIAMVRPRRLARRTPSVRFEVFEIGRLHGHERIRPALLEQLTEQIRRDGYLRRPILVADRDFVILDGHHRLEALRALGARRIPAYLIDYFSDIVQLGTWPDAVVSVITKEEVIRRGRTGDLFPPKTSRHTMTISLEDRPTDLEDLK